MAYQSSKKRYNARACGGNGVEMGGLSEWAVFFSFSLLDKKERVCKRVNILLYLWHAI